MQRDVYDDAYRAGAGFVLIVYRYTSTRSGGRPIPLYMEEIQNVGMLAGALRDYPNHPFEIVPMNEAMRKYPRAQFF